MPPRIEACFIVEPEAPLRFGGHPDDLTATRAFPASDTLFGALTWALTLTEGEAEADAWVQRFRSNEPPLLLSSALPYHAESGRALVPRPQRRPAIEVDADTSEGAWDPKVLKRTEYVEVSLLSIWRQGAPAATPVSLGEALVTAELAERLYRHAGHAKDRPRPALWRTVPRPGVTLDRRTSASQVYSVAATSYACALAVYVLADREEDLSLLERLFDVLARAGIGGRRSRGFGGFTWRRIPSPLPLSARPTGLALSLVWPRPDELERAALSPADGFGYRIVERHAWIASPRWSTERTRTVAMLGEGSYVNAALRQPVGGLPDVTPTEPRGRHPVYRYGLGVFLDEERLP